METEIQPNIPSIQHPLQIPNAAQPLTSWSKSILLVLSGLILISVSLYVGIQIGKKQTPTNQQLITMQPTPTQTITNPTTTPTPSSFDQTTTPNPTQEFDSKYNIQITNALETGQVIKKISNPSIPLPSNISSAQILNYFQLDNIYFALVMQHSTNVALNTPKNFDTTFTGILISKQGESQWINLTEIKDKQSDNKNNPYYLWTDSKQLLLSVVDQNGAGSGEGTMKLFTFLSNGSWKLTGCYYFGGTYNGTSENGDYFAYSSKLSKQNPKPLTECNNVTITP